MIGQGSEDRHSKLGYVRVLLARLLGHRYATHPRDQLGSSADTNLSLVEQLKAIEEIRSRLYDIQTGVERHAAQSARREQSIKQHYDRLIAGLLLLLDYFEEANRAGSPTQELEWFHHRVLRILRDECIEELPVQLGEQFCGEYHRHVGERPDSRPRGSVLEITRRGYWRIADGEKIALRPAEVVISSGPAATSRDATEKEAREHGRAEAQS